MTSTTDLETRGGIPAEIRADEAGIKVSGYAAVFGETTDIGGFFREVIERGAFKDAIGRDDVVFLINHNGLPLARTSSGTLTLREDARGLYMETTLDAEDPDVKSIVGKMKRGDLNKMSFAFRADVQEWDDTKDPPTRTLKKVSISDVSIVTNPAYGGTSIGLRSLESARAEIEATKSEERRKEENAAAAARRVAEKRAAMEQKIRGIRQDNP